MSQFKTQGFNRVKTQEKRREVRYPSETDVIVFCGNEFFKTKTMNLSASGILLGKALPQTFVGRDLQVMVAVKSNGKVIEEHLYTGNLVGEKRDRLHLKKIA